MAVDVLIDGEEVPWISGSVTPRLSTMSQASVSVNMKDAPGGAGSEVEIFFDDDRSFHGRATQCETTAGEDTGVTVYKASDPIEVWDKRPARDPDGDFSNPTFIVDNDTGPQILEAILEASENAALIPSAAEGPLRCQLGYFATGGPSLAGAPTDWPMTIAEVAALLVSTGQLDIVATPIDSAGNWIRIDAYNGDYGNDLTGDVVIEYGMGARNMSGFRWTEDLATVINKLWTYLGPRVATELDPGGTQHWRANITGDDPGLADPPLSAVLARRATSQADYDVRMEIEIFDGVGDDAVAARDLYRWQWLAKSWLASMPRQIVHATIAPGAFSWGDFDKGDLITVRATADAHGGFNGVQRVYEYTVTFDEDSVLNVTDLQTSAGSEGLS